jgi:hypothetical protein
VIINYDDILKAQAVLDIYVIDNLIYVALSEGIIKILRIETIASQQQLTNVSSLSVEGFG